MYFISLWVRGCWLLVMVWLGDSSRPLYPCMLNLEFTFLSVEVILIRMRLVRCCEQVLRYNHNWYFFMEQLTLSIIDIHQSKSSDSFSDFFISSIISPSIFSSKDCPPYDYSGAFSFFYFTDPSGLSGSQFSMMGESSRSKRSKLRILSYADKKQSLEQTSTQICLLRALTAILYKSGEYSFKLAIMGLTCSLIILRNSMRVPCYGFTKEPFLNLRFICRLWLLMSKIFCKDSSSSLTQLRSLKASAPIISSLMADTYSEP